MKLIETLAWPWGIVGILWLFFSMSITARVVVVVCIVLLIVMCIVWAIGNSEPMSEEERDAIIRDAKYMVDYRTKERLRKEEMERRYRMAKVVAYMMDMVSSLIYQRIKRNIRTKRMPVRITGNSCLLMMLISMKNTTMTMMILSLMRKVIQSLFNH